jgi:hypothetical protein
MSLSAPPPAVYPDLATGFTAIQAHAKQHGYALFERTQSLIGLYSYAIELVNTILRARIQLFIP